MVRLKGDHQGDKFNVRWSYKVPVANATKVSIKWIEIVNDQKAYLIHNQELDLFCVSP